MYKVFVNEKRLTIDKNPADAEKNMAYNGRPSLEMALDILENSSCNAIHIFGEQEEEIWADFQAMFPMIQAAGGVVANEAQEILFIHRLGKWDLPKGKIEKGESPEEASIREVAEETGITNLARGPLLAETYHIYKERSGGKILKKTYWYAMDFRGDEPLKPQLEEGISEAAWKGKKKISEEVLPGTFENIKLVLSSLDLG